ncbi:MAG: hypothetical protein PHR53_04360 [Bacteroidales bacterium]|nr:hypothetical protein [Bacteroidales bacterium]
MVVSTEQTYVSNNLDLPGTFIYSVTIIPLDGCSKGCEKTTTVTVNVRDIPNLSGDILVCEDSVNSVIYTTDEGNNITNYEWWLTNPTLGEIVSGQGEHSIEVLWHTEGSDSVKVTYTEDGIAQDTGFLIVTIQPLPDDVSLSGSGKYCSDDDGRDIIVVNPQIGVYYRLYREGEVAPLNTINSTNGNAISFGTYSAGTYYVKAYSNNDYNDDTCEIRLQDEVIIGITPKPPSREIQHD